jgi:hypothetical protein
MGTVGPGITVTATDGPILLPRPGTELVASPVCPAGTQPISGSYAFTFTDNADTGKVTIVRFERDLPTSRWFVTARVTSLFTGNLTLTGRAICLSTP